MLIGNNVEVEAHTIEFEADANIVEVVEVVVVMDADTIYSTATTVDLEGTLHEIVGVQAVALTKAATWTTMLVFLETTEKH